LTPEQLLNYPGRTGYTLGPETRFKVGHEGVGHFARGTEVALADLALANVDRLVIIGALIPLADEPPAEPAADEPAAEPAAEPTAP
jgi:hypothetical protein